MIISAKTTEPPPSVAQINDIELSILSRQTSYLDQGTQTEGPRVPTIPLPDVPGTSDGIGFSDVAGVLESESPGYTYIRDSQHIFQAPVEIHSYENGPFGCPDLCASDSDYLAVKNNN